jgi:preprotein translocase SecE subunit
VARDRKRAKQRRDRRATAATPPTRAPDGLRADVPGSLGHASADVDEFDAALLRGAGGVPVSPDADLDADPELSGAGLAEGAPLTEGPDVDEDEDLEFDDDLLQAPAPASGDGGGNGGAGGSGGGAGGGGGGGERPSGAPLRGGNRAVAFLRASWAELQRVQWPDRRHVSQATAVVIGFVAIAGAYLGVADYVAKEFVEFIL